MRFVLFAVACLASGCVFIFDGDDADDACALRENAEPTIAPAPLRDPGDLTCQSIGGPGNCDPSCGPCPAVAALTPPTPPIPSWPICGHVCEGKDPATCEADPQCRVVKNAECTFGPLDCFTDYVGCFPIDTVPDASIDCLTADAWDCSRSSNCTAYHSHEQACGTDAECPRPFELCMTEGQSPGQCYLPVTCRAAPPACGANETPGIEDGCYTGACIPQHLCAPNQ